MFVGSPGRGDEFAGGGIGVLAFDGDVRRQAGDGLAHGRDIVFPGQGHVAAGGVQVGQGRAGNDQGVVKFDPGDGQGGQEIDGGQEVGNGFAGQAGHDVGGDKKTGRSCVAGGPGEGSGRVPPVDAGQGGVIGRLQPHLQAHVGQWGGGEQTYFFAIQAVRPGAQTQAGDVGQIGHLGQQGGQALGRAVGIGKRLQIAEQGFTASSGRSCQRCPLRK